MIKELACIALIACSGNIMTSQDGEVAPTSLGKVLKVSQNLSQMPAYCKVDPQESISDLLEKISRCDADDTFTVLPDFPNTIQKATAMLDWIAKRNAKIKKEDPVVFDILNKTAYTDSSRADMVKLLQYYARISAKINTKFEGRVLKKTKRIQ